MNRIVLFFLFCLGINTLHAQNNRQQVTLSEAIQVALNTVNDRCGFQQAHLQTSYQKTDAAGNVLLYEVVTEKTTVLISGSKACLPILGEYSSSNSSLIEHYDDLPCGLRFFVDGYISQIERCFQEDVDQIYYQDIWDSLINGIEISNRLSPIEPLIITRWKQNGCNTGYGVGYEYYMPGIPNQCEHCKVGCGAVAMGQVMNYWGVPVVRYEEIRQFDWCNMSQELNTNMNSFFKNREAIARLLEDIWYRILDFPGCNHTTSSFDLTWQKMVNTYGYSPQAIIVNRNGFSGNWNEMLIGQLNHGWPVLYSGEGPSGGHTFICCGVNQYGQFYMNWGNGGEYDGYFEINNLHYYDTNFSSNQRAIINIYPSTNDDMCNESLQLDLFYSSFYSIPNNSQYSPYEITPQTMTRLISASSTSPNAWHIIHNSTPAVIYQAHEEIIFQDGFEVENGSEFEAKITTCEKCDESRGDINDNENNMCFVSRADNDGRDIAISSMATPQNVCETDFSPNPTDGSLNMATDGIAESMFFYDMVGRYVSVSPNPAGERATVLSSFGLTAIEAYDPQGRQLQILPATGMKAELDVSAWPRGTVLLHIHTPAGTAVKKLLLR